MRRRKVGGKWDEEEEEKKGKVKKQNVLESSVPLFFLPPLLPF